MAKQFGNFIGEFVEYDLKQLNRGFQSYMHIRVKVNVKKPLKRRKNIVVPSSSSRVYARFQYEKLFLFCFSSDRLDMVIIFALCG